ncbi:aquaporin-8-like [Polypterus senegalus]|uniref:aquaporin-8-like n=1 Tax=Polypterus senegalus TaxID=55291 RepID=UPI0019649F07|nr:aquaporin-8-like [Polypterus senegalus]
MRNADHLSASMSESESKIELYEITPVGTSEPEKRDVSAAPLVFERYVQPCAAELLGSALFIFIGCVSVIENVESTGRLQPALAHGLALAIVIAVLGEISGGHFNPAVTISVYLNAGLRLRLLFPYVAAQLCGGLIGAALAKAICSEEAYASSAGAAFNTVQTDAQAWKAVVAEMLMTLFLTLVVCMGAVNERSRTHLAPLCIGLTVAADILAGGAVSGACMNPARALGPAVIAGYWSYHWIYWLGPITGALICALFLRFILGDRKIRLFLK